MRKRVPFRVHYIYGLDPWVQNVSHSVERVNLAKLTATQAFVARGRKQQAYPPIVFESAGRLYIQDGHHRLSALRWRGCRTATVLVLRRMNRAEAVRQARKRSGHPGDCGFMFGQDACADCSRIASEILQQSTPTGGAA